MIAMLRICCIKCPPNRVNIAANANARDRAPHLRGCIYNLQFGIRPCIMPERTETSSPGLTQLRERVHLSATGLAFDPNARGKRPKSRLTNALLLDYQHAAMRVVA